MNESFLHHSGLSQFLNPTKLSDKQGIKNAIGNYFATEKYRKKSRLAKKLMVTKS